MYYHIPQNSIYVHLRVDRRLEGALECTVHYYTKASNLLLAREHGVRIRSDIIKHWHRWDLTHHG